MIGIPILVLVLLVPPHLQRRERPSPSDFLRRNLVLFQLRLESPFALLLLKPETFCWVVGGKRSGEVVFLVLTVTKMSISITRTSQLPALRKG